MARLTVPQAIVIGAIQQIQAAKPVPGEEVSGARIVILTGAQREEVLKVLTNFVRVPECRAPAERVGS